MKNAPMRFGGHSLHHNPYKLVVESDSHIRTLRMPYSEPDCESLGRKPRVISGEGELYGADCLAQYRELERLQREQYRGKLVLPHIKPFYAYLKEVALIAEPVENVVKYRFVFTEAQSPRRETRGLIDYVTKSEGETLWDIGTRYGVTVDRLVELNPQIADIDGLREGERVRLC